MRDDLVIDIGDLVGHLGASRKFEGRRHAKLRLGDAKVAGDVLVSGTIAGTVDGVQVDFEATAPVDLVCVRCLTEWSEELDVEGSQHFGKIADEDGYAVEDNTVDVGSPAIDEVALGLPAAPICQSDCKGLCPTCGTDLNSDPCDGHGDDSNSPFAALKDLFDS